MPAQHGPWRSRDGLAVIQHAFLSALQVASGGLIRIEPGSRSFIMLTTNTQKSEQGNIVPFIALTHRTPVDRVKDKYIWIVGTFSVLYAM